MPGPQLYGKPAFMAKPRAGHVRPLPLGHFKNSSIIFSPTAPDFSGWNWQPRTLPWLAAAQISPPAVDGVGQVVLIDGTGLGLIAVE